MRAIAIALFAFAGLLILLAGWLGKDWTVPSDGQAIPIHGLRRAANLTAIAFIVVAFTLPLYCAASCALGYPCWGLG